MQKTVYKASHKKSDNKHLSDFFLFLKVLVIYAVVYTVASIAALYLDIEDGLLTPVSLCAFSLSGFLSGFVAGRAKRKNGLVNGIIFSLPATVLFLFTSMCLNGFRIDLVLLISILCTFVFSAVGGIASVNIKKKIKKVK